MTRCTNRRTAILTLILGLTLLLCGCQVGGGVFVLPDISSNIDCCQVSFAVGTIGGQTFVIAVFTS